ncbi:MAG: ABC transporter permease [Arenicellales bacterium]
MLATKPGLFSYILPAYKLWQVKRLQALLSIAGIAIGVMGFVVVVAMGQGAREEFSRAVGVLGTSTVIVNSTSADGLPQLNSQMLTTMKKLMGHELSAMAPVKQTYRTTYMQRKSQRIRIVGTSNAYRDVFSLALANGRFLAPYDLRHRKRVAVLGHQAAMALFATTQANGQLFRLGREWFTVIGVLATGRSPIMKLSGYQTPDTSRTIYVPLTVMTPKAVDDLQFSKLLLKFADDQRIPAAIPLLQRIFGASFSQQKLELIIPYQLLIKKKQFQNMLELFLLGISSIILTVGIAGVLNVMLVSINTRRSEIGLRRAVGATRNDILQQFMVEGLMLALVGGTAGLLAGWGLGVIVSSWFDLPVLFDSQTVLTGFAIALLAGVLSATYPAIKAAGLHPVEALRS